MTSCLEVLNSESQWKKASMIYPGGTSTYTNFKKGERDALYSIACSPDDSSTRIYKRIPSASKRTYGAKTIEFTSYSWESVAILEEGQAFNLPVTSQADGVEFQFRVVHRKEEHNSLKFV